MSSTSINANTLSDGFYSCRLALFMGSTAVASTSIEFMFVTQQNRIDYRCLVARTEACYVCTCAR